MWQCIVGGMTSAQWHAGRAARDVPLRCQGGVFKVALGGGSGGLRQIEKGLLVQSR